jgi:4,5-DOPA dioxygenase extradiol
VNRHSHPMIGTPPECKRPHVHMHQVGNIILLPQQNSVSNGVSKNMSMPLLFLGHGNPMNALADNGWTQSWRKVGALVPKPKAILAVSAHWYLGATLVSGMEHPRTIHDFGGFPRELFEFQYPAPGDPGLAAHVCELLQPIGCEIDSTDWGLDHGTWSVLCHAFPHADVPVVQLSINEQLPAQSHFEIGKLLSPLREEGVLIVGSGNVVHNLHAFAWGQHNVEAFDWARRFDELIRESAESHQFEAIVNYENGGRDATLSAPTPDHFLPLLYVLGAARPDDTITFPTDGFDGGSISMLSILLST